MPTVHKLANVPTRAWARLDVKAITDAGGARTIEGIATTPSTDRMGDIVEPLGAKFALPMPLLYQHDASMPIGQVTFAKPTKAGIPFKATIAEAGVAAFIDQAWSLIKAGLIKGVSIGFRPLEYEPIDPKEPYGALRFTSWEWLELSAVTIPANQDATISTIKSIDTELLAASGRKQGGVIPPASGRSSSKPPQPTRGNAMKTLAQLQEERVNKTARMNELKQMWEAESRDSTEDEGVEFDGLATDVKKLNDDIRKATLDAINVTKATPVSQTEGGRRSNGHIIVKGSDQEEKFKGQNFTRMVIAKALSQRDEYNRSPATIAEARWGKTNPTLVAILKANEVPGFGSGSGEPLAELVTADNRYTGDFIEFLYGQTVFDRLALKEVPANVAIKGMDAAATAYWVGESKGIPNTTASAFAVNLTPLKVAALAVCSNELLRDSSPAAEGLVRDALGEASTQRIDTTFLSTTAASAGVSPAGMLNGVSATAATGTDAAALRADMKAMLALFDTAKIRGTITLVTTPALARAVSMMFNSLGTAQDFPGTTPNGGSLMGYNVLIGDNVPDGDIIAIAAGEVYKIGDLGVQVSISRDAMIEQSSAPTGATDTPTAASQVFTSMFQEESTAIKVVRPINFAKRRSAAVQYISGADYGSGNS